MTELSQFDANPENSSLVVGAEIEYPKAKSEDELFKEKGYDTNGIRRDVCNNGMSTFNTMPVGDPSVGLEVVCADPLQLERLEEWSTAVIDEIQNDYGTLYQPSGAIHGNTAGFHIHISEMTEEQAKRLHSMSQTEWAQVFFCTSVSNDGEMRSAPVFRGNHFCDLGSFDPREVGVGGGRYGVVNNRGDGHWEWRLPEPMTPEHTGLVEQFLRLFEQDPDAAALFAQNLLENGDSRITSIRRAEAIGFVINSADEITKSPSENNQTAMSFFQTVEEDIAAPEIYRCSMNNEEYYLFESDLSSEIIFEMGNISFQSGDILRTDTMETLDDTETQSAIESVFNQYQTQNDTENSTKSTDYLKNIMEKKE